MMKQYLINYELISHYYMEDVIYWEQKSTLSDNEVRRILCTHFGYTEVRKDTNREWITKYDPNEPNRMAALNELRDSFDSDDEFVKHLKDELLTDIHTVIRDYAEEDTRSEYDPYFYKVYIDKLFLYMLVAGLRLGKKSMDFALELAPRFGKTTWMINLLIQLFKNYNYKICILPSYWLSSLSSFEKDLKKYSGFEDYIHFVKNGNDIQSEIDNWYGKKLIVIEMSLHMAKDKLDKFTEIINTVDSSHKISIIDEADFGAWKQINSIENLNTSLNVYMSGSGLEKMLFNLKNVDDRIIQWSYTDMTLVKHGKHPLFFDV